MSNTGKVMQIRKRIEGLAERSRSWAHRADAEGNKESFDRFATKAEAFERALAIIDSVMKG